MQDARPLSAKGSERLTTPMVEESYDTKGASLAYKIACAVALPVALLLTCLPFGATLAVIRLSKRLQRRPLTVEGAKMLAKVVRRFGRYYFGRAACLEVSLGTLLAAAMLGYRLDWCLGIRFNPVGSHAWVQVGEQRILEQSGTWPYQIIVSV
jgi:transglutaminase superfamily protein